MTDSPSILLVDDEVTLIPEEIFVAAYPIVLFVFALRLIMMVSPHLMTKMLR